MTREPVRVSAGTTARELARVLETNEVSGVPVVDSMDRVIGVVSRSDLLHRCVEGPLGSRPGSFLESIAAGLADGGPLDSSGLGTVEEFMSTEPITATADEPVSAVAERMARERVHRVVVVDEKRHVVGIVTSLDVLAVFPKPA
jgi:CBS domain-containing protein